MLYYITCLAIILGPIAGQFIEAPTTCPGDTFTFRCTVTGDMSGVTIWRLSGNSECILSHSTAGATSTCGAGGAFTARAVTGFGTTNATSFSSTLNSTATPALDGTLVECFGPALSRQPGNRIGGSILQISGQCFAVVSCPLTRKGSGVTSLNPWGLWKSRKRK